MNTKITLLSFIMCFFLFGCLPSRRLSTTEIINQVKECKKAGLKPVFYENGTTGGIVLIQCITPEEVE